MFRATNRWSEGELKFMQNGNAYRLENERGGFFEGRVGNVLLEPGKRHVFAESMYLVLEPGFTTASHIATT